jgi:hypothetical protein
MENEESLVEKVGSRWGSRFHTKLSSRWANRNNALGADFDTKRACRFHLGCKTVT